MEMRGLELRLGWSEAVIVRSSAAAEKGVEKTALRTRTGARPMAADQLPTWSSATLFVVQLAAV